MTYIFLSCDCVLSIFILPIMCKSPSFLLEGKVCSCKYSTPFHYIASLFKLLSFSFMYVVPSDAEFGNSHVILANNPDVGCLAITGK